MCPANTTCLALAVKLRLCLGELVQVDAGLRTEIRQSTGIESIANQP